MITYLQRHESSMSGLPISVALIIRCSNTNVIRIGATQITNTCLSCLWDVQISWRYLVCKICFFKLKKKHLQKLYLCCFLFKQSLIRGHILLYPSICIFLINIPNETLSKIAYMLTSQEFFNQGTYFVVSMCLYQLYLWLHNIFVVDGVFIVLSCVSARRSLSRCL